MWCHLVKVKTCRLYFDEVKHDYPLMIFMLFCTGWWGNSFQVTTEGHCCECQRHHYVIHWSWLVNVQSVKIAEFVWTSWLNHRCLEVTSGCLMLSLRSWLTDYCLFCSNALCCTSCVFCMQTFSVFLFITSMLCIYPSATVNSILPSLLLSRDDLYFLTTSADCRLWWCTVQSNWCTDRDICLSNLRHFYCILVCNNCDGKLLFDDDTRTVFLILFTPR